MSLMSKLLLSRRDKINKEREKAEYAMFQEQEIPQEDLINPTEVQNHIKDGLFY